MNPPELTPQIQIPKWQLEKVAGKFPFTACVQLLIEVAKYLAARREVAISNVLYSDSAGGGQSLFMHHCCLLKLRTPTLPEGVILSLDGGGQVCLRIGEGEPVKPEAHKIFERILAVFTAKVAQAILTRMNYDTDLAFETERDSWRQRIRVRGILKGQEETAHLSNRNRTTAREIYVFVLPTANVQILLERFNHEEEAQVMKDLRRYFELAGLVLRENDRPPKPCGVSTA